MWPEHESSSAPQILIWGPHCLPEDREGHEGLKQPPKVYTILYKYVIYVVHDAVWGGVCPQKIKLLLGATLVSVDSHSTAPPNFSFFHVVIRLWRLQRERRHLEPIWPPQSRREGGKGGKDGSGGKEGRREEEGRREVDGSPFSFHVSSGLSPRNLIIVM